MRSPVLVAVLTAVAVLCAACGTSAGPGVPVSASGQVREQRGIAYPTVACPPRDSRTETADAYLPATATASSPVPAVVLIHGGSFVAGSRSAGGFVANGRDLAAHCWAAFSIDYCLPPQGTPGYPVEGQDVAAFVDYVVAHAVTFGVDPHRIVLWGGSAGATLAVDTATHLGNAQVAAAVGWSGGYSFTDPSGAHTSNERNVANYLGCPTLSTPSCAATALAASAADHVTPSTPPMYLANSTAELVPLPQLTDMTAALHTAGVEVRTQILPGDQHATAYTAVAFLAARIGSTTGTCTAPSPSGARG